MLNWNSIIIEWTKNDATLHFAGYLENYTKDIYMIFAHIKASVYWICLYVGFSNFISYARLLCARDTDRHCDIMVLMLHYQVASDSPGGATSNNKRSKLAHYRLLHYTLALVCAQNCVIIVCSLPDIWENVERIASFLAHPVMPVCR